MFVEVSNIKKSYGEGGSYVQVLKGVSVGVEKGEMCVIQGTSGSGKSTMSIRSVRAIPEELSEILTRTHFVTS